jgi:hypothetical protein
MKATRSRGPDLSKGAGGTTQAPCASRLQAIDSVTAAAAEGRCQRHTVETLYVFLELMYTIRGPDQKIIPGPGRGNCVLNSCKYV